MKDRRRDSWWRWATTLRAAWSAGPGLVRGPGPSVGGGNGPQTGTGDGPDGSEPDDGFLLARAEREVNDARFYAERSLRGVPDLVWALATLGECQRRLGLHTAALASAQEAVALARGLVESGRPTHTSLETGHDLFEQDRILAGTLSNLGVHLSSVGRLEEALVAHREAVGMLRRPTPQRQRPAATGRPVTDPTGRYHHLSVALTNLGNGLFRLGGHEQARDAHEEAVELGRWVVSAHPQDGEPDLATALNSLSAVQSKLGHNTDAVAAATEAVSIRRRLDARHPARFRTALGSALNNLGWALTSAGHHQEALAPTGEAVRIYRSITVISTTEVADHYVCVLGSYGKARAYAGVEIDEAAAALEEAVVNMQTMATTLPLAFTARLSETYDLAADAFDRLGHTARAAYLRQLRDTMDPPGPAEHSSGPAALPWAA